MLNTIMPTPKFTEDRNGTSTIPFLFFCDPAFASQGDAFCRSLQILTGCTLTEGKGGIEFRKDASLAADAYVMDASEEGVILSASDEHGISFAAATALQCLTKGTDGLVCPNGRIEDRPDKEYRALMVDLSSVWHPLRTLLRYVDVCYMMKIKYLHLHFIDMARYTLPSKAFPLIGGGKEQYTEEEIAELNEYALARGIVIIPEFEAPGHAASMTTTYPEVFANRIQGEGGSLETEVGTLYGESVICPGRKECEDGIRTLLTEMCELFPHSPYIHIGGDEAAYPVWDNCPDCIAYREKHGISDSHELYSEIVGRVAQMVFDLGRTPIVWEGFPEKGVRYIPKETIVIAWESHYMLVNDILKHGFKVINGSWQPLYIVESLRHRWYPREIINWNVYEWQHWWANSHATLNPIHVPETEDVLGAQVSSWGCTYEQDISRVVENLCALTERTWNVKRLYTEKEYNARQKNILATTFALIQDR